MNHETYHPVLTPAIPGVRLDPAVTAWKNGLLVRSPNWLGDILMCMPAVYKMRGCLPAGARLFVLCPQGLSPVWEAADWVDTVIPFTGKRVTGPSKKAARDLRAGVGVVMPNSFGSAWDLVAAGIPVRIGRGGRGRSLLLTHRLPCWRRGPGLADKHHVNHYLELAAVFGDITWDAAFPPLAIPGHEAVAADFGVTGGNWLAVLPGAAYGPAKQWPVEHYRAVAEWWEKRGGRIVTLGTQGDMESAAAIVAGLNGAVNLAGKTNLRQLMAILQAVDGAVANDSGGMHLAAALGTSGVGVFGSTDPIATGPLGAPWIIARESCDCSPCFERLCPRADDLYTCLEKVSPESVIADCQRILATL
ncbi:MAG: lipopolysaccharide heptosyltransferase II [Lentisphaeria bacterium]|nr:lipopolysaccharide heptosyltransferase II [Lentisphaeria bacterium]